MVFCALYWTLVGTLLNQPKLSPQSQLIYAGEFVRMDHSVKLIKLQLAMFSLKGYTITCYVRKKILCYWMDADIESNIVAWK